MSWGKGDQKEEERAREMREMWSLSLGRASVGLLEQIKEWPVREMA